MIKLWFHIDKVKKLTMEKKFKLAKEPQEYVILVEETKKKKQQTKDGYTRERVRIITVAPRYDKKHTPLYWLDTYRKGTLFRYRILEEREEEGERSMFPLAEGVLESESITQYLKQIITRIREWNFKYIKNPSYYVSSNTGRNENNLIFLA